MKKLIILSTLIFSVTFSSPSFADWKKVGENVAGATFYVDFERIRKHDGYVYWWGLADFLKPSPNGRLSGKSYYQGDCKLFRHKVVADSHYNEPMGRGVLASGSNTPDKEWTYPPPNSLSENVLKRVCAYAK
jgi:hypothetical protein